MGTLPERPLPAGDQAAAISRLVVRTISHHTGRGPTKVRTYLTGDVIVVVLRDTLIKSELTLAAKGKSDLVVEIRRAFQQTMRQDFVSGVEAITGRTVIGFLSDHQVQPDISTEVFVMTEMATDAVFGNEGGEGDA